MSHYNHTIIIVYNVHPHTVINKMKSMVHGGGGEQCSAVRRGPALEMLQPPLKGVRGAFVPPLFFPEDKGDHSSLSESVRASQ